MDLTHARETKVQLAGYARDLAARYGGAVGTRSVGEPADAVRAPTLAIGITRADGAGEYEIAVRYRLGVPAARAVVRKVVAEAGPTADVRRTGRIRRLGPGRRGSVRADALERQPPVATALAVGETDRVRPLRPGVSIAHVDVTAGTLGGFVVVDPNGPGAPDRPDLPGGTDALYALSNRHVLDGDPGDGVLQPGPADGGSDPADRVGTIAAVAPLARGERAGVDAAIALLDDPQVDLDYPVGRLTMTADAVPGDEVEKIGRTTGHTHGRVSAIEMDDVLVGYGPELGVLAFDGQIEVESTGSGPFSRGGDSGSLVYRADGVALGLLFAGSETGGEGGTGLTYVNPIDVVLDAFGVRLR
ncbi:hypothetical protein GCM10009718_13120 [Isoptericola halotolerans]|uniref:Uncharacterized protein n=1 Tax=Isoptericola halotolerans TaxID=300560 RepID=A0ABX1ZYU2_9MICO|nr:hypothetical protein [Isoptericola halotolerans]NOV95768.1 hypothetical protein [Isoptericola halotolerans]